MSDASKPTKEDVENGVAAAAPEMGDLFARAVFASFFHRPVIGMTPGTPDNGPGMPGMPPMLQFGPNPVEQVARTLWERHGEQAKHQIVDAIDVDEVIQRIAERVYQRLTDESERNDRYGSMRDLAPSFADVQRITREKLADKLSERQMAAYDREQTEMRAAWQREQERARTTPAQIEAPKSTETETP